ncbi:unnamed protein product [Amoebophrya sp. A120]|nr:unnamed protein product [Amoebophrya sp. A120]|eukprot:GSA120T00013122001.1
MAPIAAAPQANAVRGAGVSRDGGTAAGSRAASLPFVLFSLVVAGQAAERPGPAQSAGAFGPCAAAPAWFWLLIRGPGPLPFGPGGRQACGPPMSVSEWASPCCTVASRGQLHRPRKLVGRHVGRPDCGDAMSPKLRGPGGTRYAKHPPTGACLSCSTACFLSATRGRRVLEELGPHFCALRIA